MEFATPSKRPLLFVLVSEEDEWAPEEIDEAGEAFVVFTRGGTPSMLSAIGESESGLDVPALKERGEELTEARIAIAGGAGELPVYFGRAGAVLQRGDVPLFVPAPKPFVTVADVRASLEGEGLQTLAAFEPLPGPGGPISPGRGTGPCPGPPAHWIQVPLDNPICPLHGIEVATG